MTLESSVEFFGLSKWKKKNTHTHKWVCSLCREHPYSILPDQTNPLEHVLDAHMAQVKHGRKSNTKLWWAKPSLMPTTQHSNGHELVMASNSKPNNFNAPK